MTTELANASDSQQQSQTQQQTQKKDFLPSMPGITSSSSWHPSSKTDKDSFSGTTQTQPQEQTRSLADPNIKFPLENSLSFHFFKNEKTKTWKDNVKFITTVDFVEDFWGLVANQLDEINKCLLISDHLGSTIICSL